MAAIVNDMVNHPPHYNRDGALEMIKELEIIFGKEKVIDFCIMNAWKYRYRAGFKSVSHKDEDMKKSDWYINKAKTLMEE